MPASSSVPSSPKISIERDPERDLDRPSLGHSHRSPIATWAYQLQDIKVADIARLDVDLAVVDCAADGSDDTTFRPADVARMQSRPDGRRKRVVSYMSIGEAESYRFYWKKNWKRKEDKPAWLDRENPDWHENYKVRYWDPDWQRIIFGSPSSYLDRIMAAGFDGVYLDIIDGYEYYERNRPTARAEMIAFVQAIARYARVKRPEFMVIPQNGEALLEDASYRAVISAIAKEDLYFGLDDDQKPNTPSETRESLESLAYAKADGIPVLVVEYLEDEKKIARVSQDLGRLGYAVYYGPRDLDSVRFA